MILSKLTYKIDPKIKRCIILLKKEDIPIYKLYYNPLLIPFILLGANIKPGLYLSFYGFFTRLLISYALLYFIIGPCFFNFKSQMIHVPVIFISAYFVSIFLFKNDVLPVRKKIGVNNWNNI